MLDPRWFDLRSLTSWTVGLAVTPHDPRRTFGSLDRAPGADLRWVQTATGHEPITTTARIYAPLYDELDGIAAAVDRIGRER